VSTSVVKWTEGLGNRVSIIMRRCIDRIRFANDMAVMLITFFHILLVLFFYHCVCGCTFYMLLFNFVNYVFFFMLCILIVMLRYSNCYVCSVLGILFHCVFLCIVCV